MKEPITGNLIWIICVSALSAVIIIPLWRGELSPEALNNLAVSAIATLSAICMAAAGFVWRGKIESQAPNGNGGNGGTTTTTIPNPPAPPITIKTEGSGATKVSPLDEA